jgi:hypothetical protein
MFTPLIFTSNDQATKRSLRPLIAETKKTNEQLSDLRSEITALKSDAK